MTVPRLLTTSAMKYSARKSRRADGALESRAEEKQRQRIEQQVPEIARARNRR